jgi:phosphoglycerol transferase
MAATLWVQATASVLLLLAAVYAFSSAHLVRAALAAVFLSVLLTAAYVVSDSLTGAGITEATVFHVLYGTEGLHAEVIAVPALAGLAMIAGAVWLLRRAYRAARLKHVGLSLPTQLTVAGACATFALLLHPTVLQSKELVASALDASRAQVLNQDLAGLARGASVVPRRSLVYIYAESLERSFFDEERFPGLVTELRQLEQGALSFRGVRQAPMTDWTIAGMVASQCGVPLAPFRSNRNDFSRVDEFMPGATCLGDLLQNAGYRNAYVGGADLAFAGKGRFYADHGFTRVVGRDEVAAAQRHPPPLSKWGVHDDVMLETAFREFVRLSSEPTPFALVLLTLDTHPPEGHPTPACRAVQPYGDGSNPTLNAVRCADHLLAAFVRRLEAHAAANDVDLLVVVASDHLMMRSAATPALEAMQDERENLLFVRGKGVEPRAVRREATTLDVAPTLLGLMGSPVGTMALGRDLLMPEPTLAEKYGSEQFFQLLQNWRLALWRVWDGRAGSV